MKNILFLTESFSGKASPNGNCVKKITDVLSVDNNVNVIALRSDAELPRQEIINKTKVHRINTYFSWRLANFFKSNSNLIYRILDKLNRIFKSLLSYYTPLRAPLVLHSYVKTGKKIILTEKIDVIVAVYKDFEDTYAGVILKKKFPNIKLMVYCLDAIRGG